MGEKEAYTNFSYDSMLPLDMLAEVASETLKSDPTLGYRRIHENQNNQSNMKNGVQKRSATNCELLNLDQIKVLSDRMLIEMFSEHSSDEIRKNFSYKCYLIPDKCCEIFSSFGSETKARLQIKSHLSKHIAQLVDEANAAGVERQTNFVAEPLNVRKRRLQEMSPKKKKKGKVIPKKFKNNLPKKSIDKKSANQKSKCLKDDFERKINSRKFSKNVSNQAVAANLFVANTRSRLKKNLHSNNIKKGLEKENGFQKLPSALEGLYYAMQVSSSHQDVQNDVNIINSCMNLYSNVKVNETLSKIGDNSLLINKIHKSESSNCSIVAAEKLEVETPKRDVACSSFDQSRKFCTPEWHDHTYTSTSGKTYVGDTGDTTRSSTRSSKDNPKINHRCTAVSPQLVIPTPPFPYVYEPLLPHISEIREIGSTHRRSCDKCFHTTTSTGCSVKRSNDTAPNPSPPSTNKHARCQKVSCPVVPEEIEPDSEDNENVPVSFASNGIKERLSEQEVSMDGSSEQSQSPAFSDKNNSTENLHLGERKLALKCIRALRQKKKDERGPLICQICNGKSFTAQATLMYHYRSHAGIKPFSCSVCDATFTRQHSLNYHMLIHNNKSRFICNDCGRSFRHPSHYKEHLRRHTGETPYQCTDCSLRFKTRNTYKRHLKTRHGKILTARGIRILSIEEFDKVRTMPRRRTSKQSPIPSEAQESQWSDITFSQMPEVKNEL